TAANADDLERILQNFRNKRLVLIDTPGMGQRDVRLADQLSMLRDDRFMIQSCLVISAITQAKALQEMLKAFGVFHLSACILTKLDEAVTYGALVSALIEHPLPLAFTCDGQRVPEDLHRADARKLIALCAGEEGRQDGPMNVYSNPRKMSHSYA
ncbi:MAG: flagellar biosynthesis protein FlhF, partial [Pseudomonadota bacterium]